MATKQKLKPEDFSTKSFNVYFPFETKDATVGEDESGKIITIQGYANFCKDANSETDVFVDHCGDVMVPDGFDLSVWNKNPQILWQHSRDYTIGKGLNAIKQKDGLVVTCEIHEKAMEEQDFYKIEQGLVTMFSVGFRTIKGEFKTINDKEVFFITKALLYEVSVVSIPMNSESQFTRIKSLEDGSFFAESSPSAPRVDVIAEKNKTFKEDLVKLSLRDLLPEDKVKEIEGLGMGASLDELQEVDTKGFIEALVAKEVKAAVAKALEDIKAEQTKSADAPAEETATETVVEEEATTETVVEEPTEEDGKSAPEVSFKELTDSIAELKALALAE